MWSFFKKKSSKKDSKQIKRHTFNWCLFVPNDSCSEFGVFFSSLGPGIKDCKKGVLYIMPENYVSSVNYKTLTASMAKNIVLEYYGVINTRASRWGPKETVWLKR